MPTIAREQFINLGQWCLRVSDPNFDMHPDLRLKKKHISLSAIAAGKRFVLDDGLIPRSCPGQSFGN